MKILVADDNADIRNLLVKLLSRWGHEVTSVADGRKAWEKLTAEDSPRLVVLDWSMPGIDGVELCRLLRKAASGNPHYIILLTSKTGSENAVTALDAGANDYMTKPCNFNEFRARVQAGCRVLDHQARLRDQERLQGALQMCGAVCHEINQPLQTILTCAESLSASVHPQDPNYEVAVTIQDNVKRLGDMTRRIMNVNSIDTRKLLNGEIQIVDLNEFPKPNQTNAHDQ
jgi:sigma-B regulation protein RsbU (phosphoserine phosphatase)